MSDWFSNLQFVPLETDPTYAAECSLTFPNGHSALLQVRRYPQGNRAVDVRTSLQQHGVGPLSFNDTKRLLYELKHAKPIQQH